MQATTRTRFTSPADEEWLADLMSRANMGDVYRRRLARPAAQPRMSLADIRRPVGLLDLLDVDDRPLWRDNGWRA